MMRTQRDRTIFLVTAAALLFSGSVFAQTPTPTPTRVLTPTLTPTSNRTCDLEMSKTASPNPLGVGQDLTYTLIARNNGPSSLAPGVTIEDRLPAGVTFVSVSISPSGSCFYSGGIVRCGIDFLIFPIQVVIVVRPANLGRITNSAEVRSSGAFDPNPGNNVATVTTDVEGTFGFLRGSGAVANPPILYLDRVAPIGASAKYKDSAAVRSGLTNPWVEVGTWSGQPALFAGALSELPDLYVWLGLKNGDDEGTKFDLRVEVWKNSLELVASGEIPCVQGVTRSPDKAKEVAVPFDLFPPVGFDGTTDVLSLRILTRIGSHCAGHASATGLRLYFDSEARPSGLGIPAALIPQNHPNE